MAKKPKKPSKPLKLAKKGKPAPKAKPAKKAAAKASSAAEKAARRKPASQPLPGMENVRYTELDGICESIGRIREKKNKLLREEKEELADAMASMQARGVLQYRHDGVELVRVIGSESLKVRLVDDTGDSSVPAPGPTGPPPADPEAGDVLDDQDDGDEADDAGDDDLDL